MLLDNGHRQRLMTADAVQKIPLQNPKQVRYLRAHFNAYCNDIAAQDQMCILNVNSGIIIYWMRLYERLG